MRRGGGGRGGRGGYRGGFRGAAGGADRSTTPSSSALDEFDDNPELRTMRQKYSEQLQTVKPLFPDWSDLDLLLALGEASGQVELAVARIAEGHAEQFESVTSKKNSAKSSNATIGNSHANEDSAGSGWGASASPSAGPAARGGAGGRGGRGGFAGRGRGGACKPISQQHAYLLLRSTASLSYISRLRCWPPVHEFPPVK